MLRRLLLLVAATALLITGASPAFAGMSDTHFGLHVPWAVGGPYVDASGTLVQHPGEWPDFPVESIRLWDTRTAWLNLNPRAGVFTFEHLDAQLATARAHGVQHVTLVLAGTPRWAARSLDDADAPWLGPGSAAPPRDIADWVAFVTAVAERYRGEIEAYEIGNEPNLPMFWRGTPAELAALVNAAGEVIHRVDPDATVVAPAVLMTTPRDAAHLTAFLAPIEPEAIDAVAFHWYPTRSETDRVGQAIASVRSTTQRLSLERLPLWITEANPGSGSRPQTLVTQAAAMRRAGIARVHWYAWMQEPASHLMPLRGNAHTLRVVSTTD